ncbi:hypothetical protein LRS10_21995 [Phenylobacterium sp. J426]|uniref:hypothetical protein n=1 Tax=Phenylobacterium sp. J426 TaxID=2898439 RepID=UPI00215087E7|nr:hypothetical protein [Phenylobacterium sp. J426]MCR5876583.1 hypothetical protein [Phenylobacterium sp. J426]
MQNEYLERAEEAERLAKYARNEAERADFLKIAEIWRNLATEKPLSPDQRAKQRRDEREPK